MGDDLLAVARRAGRIAYQFSDRFEEGEHIRDRDQRAQWRAGWLEAQQDSQRRAANHLGAVPTIEAPRPFVWAEPQTRKSWSPKRDRTRIERLVHRVGFALVDWSNKP